MKRRNRRILGMTLAILVLAATLATDRYYRGLVHRDNMLRIADAAEVGQTDLETHLRLRVVVTDDLEAFLRSTLPSLTAEGFKGYARSVLDHTPRLRALEYVDASGIIRYVYPVKGNEQAVGLDLTKRPASVYLDAARQTGKTNVSAPQILAQGSYSVVIRSPIFRDGEFLGLAQAVFDMSSLFDHLSKILAAHYSFELEDAAGVSVSSSGHLVGPTTQVPVTFGGTDWRLVVGWLHAEPRASLPILALIWAVGLLVGANIVFWIRRTGHYITGLSESFEQTSADLVSSQIRYRTLVETADDMILQFGLDGSLLFANSAFKRAATQRPEPPGSTDSPLPPQGEADRLRAHLPDVIRVGATSIEYTVPGTEGRTAHRYGRMNLIRDDNGNPDSILVIIRDITEQKRLEEEASRLQTAYAQAQRLEAVGRLAAGIAHDFNNILMVINGNAELLRLQVSESEQAVSIAESILHAGKRAAQLVAQLLSYSRKQIESPQVISLNREVQQVRKIIDRLIGENIEIMERLDPELWNIRVAPNQVEQVIMNLAVNARDAMPDGGTLAIETTNEIVSQPSVGEYGDLPPGDYVKLTVRDNGEGMSPETKSHIFEPFFSTKGRDGGTGLGLATVYGIVQQSGGFIAVESDPGRGTEFALRFPRVEETPASLAPPADDGPAGSGSETVLLVEDGADIRRLALQVLEGRGYEVIEAIDGLHAVELSVAHQGQIDLLLTDVVMPGMSGYELANRLLATDPGLGIIFMSGYNDGEEAIRTGSFDDAPRLQKPFTLSTLLSTVREVLDRTR